MNVSSRSEREEYPTLETTEALCHRTVLECKRLICKHYHERKRGGSGIGEGMWI